jgi:dTDP-4-amino-4,6-dideoxygalactose transaminase
MLVQGELVARFETLLEGHLGAPALAVSSGTAALHLAVLALDLEPGSEIIVPAFTWPSTAHVVAQAGLVPRFVDVDADTFACTRDGVEAVINDRTAALLPVHLFGVPAPIQSLCALAETHGLAVIEDAACAIGCVVEGRALGTWGDLGCYSFHPRKVITTGEGGAVVATDPELVARVASLRNHGQVPGPDGVRFEWPGLNYRLPEIGGALGVGEMGRLNDILVRRRALGRLYLDALAQEPRVRVPAGYRDPASNFQAFCIEVDAERRAGIMAGLRSREVQCTFGTYAVTDQPWYIERLGVDPGEFPTAQRLARTLLALPLHPGMREGDVETVVTTLSAVLDAELDG